LTHGVEETTGQKYGGLPVTYGGHKEEFWANISTVLTAY